MLRLRSRYSRKRLEDKIEEINEKLQDFKAFEKETERDRKQREHIGRMKELFQGRLVTHLP